MGDEFAHKTFHSHFKNNKTSDGAYNTYTFKHFEVREFLTSKYSGNIRNIISRIRNGFVTAVNEHAVLPKLVVVILDDDIIQNASASNGDNLSIHYRKILECLFRLVNRVFEVYKDLLPEKAKRDNVPHILWMAPPTHKFFTEDSNTKRNHFTVSLASVVSQFKNMSMLKMLKFWDHNDSNLFMEENYKFTSAGLTIYWRSVDAAIKFWNVALAKKFEKNRKNPGQQNKRQNLETENGFNNPHGNDGYVHHPKFQRRNRFKWSNPIRRRRLPSPP